MVEMNMQDRYEDICRISGLSEEIVRRVLKATKQSCATSLKKGYRATVPGICTIVPEERSRLMVGGSIEKYIKIKVKPSASLESELQNLDNTDSAKEEQNLARLNLLNPELRSGIRTTQISALL